MANRLLSGFTPFLIPGIASLLHFQTLIAQPSPSLKETFKNNFLIGAALSVPQFEGRDTAATRVIAQQFNAVTPENVMKAEIIQPDWNTYILTWLISWLLLRERII